MYVNSYTHNGVSLLEKKFHLGICILLQEEMLIFMEFCAEGTLESLVAGSGNGLPEPLVRKYTHQLLSAVSVLHSHGIVHRDIKCMYCDAMLKVMWRYIYI